MSSADQPSTNWYVVGFSTGGAIILVSIAVYFAVKKYKATKANNQQSLLS